MKKLLPGILVLVLLGGLLALPTAYFLQLGRRLDFRCEEHPPAETFRRCFGAAPAGVWDMRAAGFSTISGAAIWMRFRYGEGDLAHLLPGYAKLPPAEARSTVERLLEDERIWRSTAPAARPEAHRPHWQELDRLRDPEVHEKSQQYAGARDFLVVDRGRRLAYYHHFNP